MQRCVRVTCFVYEKQGKTIETREARLRILPGVSPVRLALAGSEVLGGRESLFWQFPMSRIRFKGTDAIAPGKQVLPSRTAAVVARRLEALPEAIRADLGVVLQDELVAVSAPTADGERVIVAFPQGIEAKPKYAFLQRGEDELEEITEDILARGELDLEAVLSRVRWYDSRGAVVGGVYRAFGSSHGSREGAQRPQDWEAPSRDDMGTDANLPPYARSPPGNTETGATTGPASAHLHGQGEDTHHTEWEHTDHELRGSCQDPQVERRSNDPAFPDLAPVRGRERGGVLRGLAQDTRGQELPTEALPASRYPGSVPEALRVEPDPAVERVVRLDQQRGGLPRAPHVEQRPGRSCPDLPHEGLGRHDHVRLGRTEGDSVADRL